MAQKRRCGMAQERGGGGVATEGGMQEMRRGRWRPVEFPSTP